MKYPKFLDSNSNIGVVALSAGVGRKIDSFDKSIEFLKDNFSSIIETSSVRINHYVSNTGIIRGEEFNSLVDNKDVDMIINAAGGDFCLECLPYIDFDKISNNPKWVMGASDPTSILYTLTTKYDVATLYGFNAGSFDDNTIHECQRNCIDIIKGKDIIQHSFEYYEEKVDFDSTERNLTGKVKWINANGDFNVTGRIIGGCFDVLKNLVGTPYDNTEAFCNKYSDDGIIWYFDIFAMSAEDFYLSLLQMKYANWFNNTKAVVIGRVLFPAGFIDDFKYIDAAKKIFNDIPIVVDACIGHVFPKMTIINGSIATISSSNNSGSIKFELK